MTIASNLGFPRIGHRRELKFALEKFWSGELDKFQLQEQAAALRAKRSLARATMGRTHYHYDFREGLVHTRRRSITRPRKVCVISQRCPAHASQGFIFLYVL
jgi:hypothetical protein